MYVHPQQMPPPGHRFPVPQNVLPIQHQPIQYQAYPQQMGQQYQTNNPIYNQQFNKNEQSSPQRSSQPIPAPVPAPGPGYGFNAVKNPSLMQPPALNEQPLDTNSQLFQQRQPMTMSNNQHSQFDTYHHQEEEQWVNEEHIASMFWEQRCMTLLDRFKWFYDRFDILRTEYHSLSEEMLKMDSEDEWHHFQQHHDEFHEKIEEMDQELAGAMAQNEQLFHDKRTQDNQAVWEQRYQELLGNFKSLQQQMAQMESSGGRAGGVTVSSEQYRQLQQHCAELEYQYGEVINQLQRYRDGGVNSSEQMEQQMSAYMQEIENYKSKLNSLHNENVELQNMLGETEEQNEELKQEMYKSGVDRSKFQELLRHVEVKDQEIRTLQEEFKSRSVQQPTTNYQQILQQRNKEIEEFQRLLNEKNNEIGENRLKLQSIQELTKKKLKQQFDISLASHQKKIQELEKQILVLKIELQKSGELTYKFENAEKKLSYSNQEVHNLNETLKKKNQQLIELRSLAYEIEKLKEAQGELIKAADERDRLADAIRKKNQEIENMHREIEHLNMVIQEATSKRQQYSARNLRAEIQDLVDQLRRGDSEMNKIRGILVLKEDYSFKLQEQLRATREKLTFLEQVLQTEREEWKQRELKLNTKSNDFDQRIKTIDFEFNLQLKETLEREVTALRKQNTEKQQIIREHEEKQIILSSKLAVFEKQKVNFDKDIHLLKEKQKEILLENQAQQKRYKDLQNSIRAKDDELLGLDANLQATISQLNNLKLQIEQYNSLIKSKNRTIEELQGQLANNLVKTEHLDKLSSENAKLMMVLEAVQQQKAKAQQSPLFKSKGMSATNSKKQFDKQQSTIVNQLYQQNQILKEQISKILQRYSETGFSKTKDSKIISLDLHKRLNEFNNRLQLTIGTGTPNELSESQKSVFLWEKQRNILVSQYENEIKSLKDQLERKKLAGSQTSNQTSSNYGKKALFGNLEAEKLRDEVDFLREKGKQQEQRNSLLIKINEQLKGKLDSALKLKQNNATLDYYKDQFQRSEADNDQLKIRLKKTSEDNRQFKLQLASKHTKISQEFQFKVLQLEMVIHEQQRKITQLQGQKAAANNEKASLLHDLNLHNLDIKHVNNGMISPKSAHSNVQFSGIQNQMGSLMGNTYSINRRNDISPIPNIKGVNSRVQRY